MDGPDTTPFGKAKKPTWFVVSAFNPLPPLQLKVSSDYGIRYTILPQVDCR